MPFAALALSLLLHNKGAASSAMDMAKRATAPGVVDHQKLQGGSVADLAREVIHCYHKTARFNSVDVAPQPWDRQSQYGADSSTLMRIHYSGITGIQHQMIVAVLGKESQVRTAIVSDSDRIPASKRCELEDWTGN